MRRSLIFIFKLLTLFVGSTLSAQVVDSGDSLTVPTDSLAVVKADSVPKAKPSSTNLEKEVNYYAEDSISYDVNVGTAYLYNEAHVDYGDIVLEAGFIAIDFDNNVVTATGIRDSTGTIIQKPIFTEQGKEYAADTIRYNFRTRRARIQTITTQEGEGFIHGDKVKMIGQNTFYIKEVSFTTCNLEHPHFDIVASRAKVIVGEKVVTGPAFLRIADVTTPLFVPFGFFPMQDRRASGIIIPSYTDQIERGFGLLNLGYYYAVNDHLDLSVLGDIYTKGSFAVTLSSNYNVRYRYNGNASVAYSRIRVGDPRYADAGRFSESRDFNFKWRHAQDPKARPDLRFTANVNIATGTFYRNNSTNPQDYLNNSFQSSISLTKNWQGSPFTLAAAFRHQQNNSNQQFTMSLPNAVLTMNRIQPFAGDGVGAQKWYERIGVTSVLEANAQVRDSLSAYDNPARILEGNRLQYGATNRWVVTTNEKVLKFVTVTPQANYAATWLPERYTYRYDTTLQEAVADTMQGFNLLQSMSFSANATTKLYGLFNFRGRLSALRHIATPTVGLSYTPDYTTTTWNYFENVQVDSTGRKADRFVYEGQLYGARPGRGGGAVNFALQNNLDAKWRSSNDSVGEKKFAILERLNFATSYNLQAEEFNWSPLRVNANNTFFGGKLGFSYQGTFDFYGIDTAGVRVNESALKVNGQLLRNTENTLSLDLRLQGGERGDANPSTGRLGLQSNDPNYYQIYDYMNVSALWTLNLGYSYQTRTTGLNTNVTQTVTVSGSLEPTPNWRLGFSSGYDLVEQGVTYTTIDLKRDLHCWQFSVRWVPFGFNRSYTFAINAKAALFSDLKYEQTRRRGQL